MTIKHSQIGKVYSAVKKLTEQKLPAKKAYKVFLLHKKLYEVFEFALTEEKKLIEKYGATVEDGYFKLEEPENTESFKGELEDLATLETDLELEAVVLEEKDLDGLVISAAEIETLDGFVSFG